MTFINPNAPEPINTSVPLIQTMHADTASSDTTKLIGPRGEHHELTASFHYLQATAPTILRRSDGNVMALVTSFDDLAKRAITHQPIVQVQVLLIDGDSGAIMGDPKTVKQVSMMAGVYAYLDQSDDSLILTSTPPAAAGETPQTHIFKYTAIDDGTGGKKLSEPDPLGNITSALYPPQYLYGATSGTLSHDGIVSLSPDHDGDIWFATAQGNIGICHVDGSPQPPVSVYRISSADQPETINNSFSTAKDENGKIVAAVTTNRATYVFDKDTSGDTPTPALRWRAKYDHGTAWKPGQLAYPGSFFVASEDDDQTFGTGATPSFFGPETGGEWVTITDNADGAMHLLVYDVVTGERIALAPTFVDDDPRAPYARATENSAIAYGNSIIIPSTAGYPYPVPPTFDHGDAPFVGGITRFDIVPAQRGGFEAQWKWTAYHRSSAVPRFTFQDGIIYTVLRTTDGATPSDPPSYGASVKDTFAFAGIDFETGEIVFAPKEITPPVAQAHPKDGGTALSALGDPLQMVGCITLDGSERPTYWQGTFAGFYQIKTV